MKYGGVPGIGVMKSKYSKNATNPNISIIIANGEYTPEKYVIVPVRTNMIINAINDFVKAFHPDIPSNFAKSILNN